MRLAALLLGRQPRFWIALVAAVGVGAAAGVLLTAAGDGRRASSSASSPSTSARPLPVGTSEPSRGTETPDGRNSDENEDEDPVKPSLPAAVEGPPAPLPAATSLTCPSASITVRTADELTAALARVSPGDVIRLGDGVYAGAFVANESGTPAQPIWLCGGPGAILDGEGIKKGYALHLAPAQYWRVIGFTVRNAQKGVVADGTRGTVIQGLTVEDIGDEAIHLRTFSTGSAVLGNTIRRTGLRRDKFGEGVYIGSATSNWPTYSAGNPDRSDNNLVHGNRISQTGSESVDVKEGTTGGVVSGNTFDGAGMTGADSWVDVKGNGWLIVDNVGRNTPLDGFQTHEILKGWGTRNTFRGNTADVPSPGFGFHLAPELENTVSCDNRSADGSRATSKPECRP